MLIILLVLGSGVGSTAAEEEWWKINWSVRKDHGVDGFALLLRAIAAAVSVFKAWKEEDGGMKKELWKPNKKFTASSRGYSTSSRASRRCYSCNSRMKG